MLGSASLSSPGVSIPPAAHPMSSHSRSWVWVVCCPHLHPLSIGIVLSAILYVIAVDNYPHPPCKQMLTAVVVELVTPIIVLSVIHWCTICRPSVLYLLPSHVSSPSIATPIHPASRCSQQWRWCSSLLLSPSVGILPHKQLLKELDAGGVLSAVLPGDSIVSNGVMDEALRSVYLVGIPLHESPSTPLPPMTFSILSIPMASHPICMGRRGLGVYIQSLVCTCAMSSSVTSNSLNPK
jgi:hypothetical protein